MVASVAAREWKGTAYDAALPLGRSDCILSLRSPYLVATLPSGERLRLDLRRVAQTRGGPDGGLWVFGSEEPGSSSFTTTDPGLADVVHAFGLRGTNRQTASGSARRSQTGRRILGRLAMVGVALLLVHVLLLGPLAGLGVRAIPVSVDDDLGRNAMESAVEMLSWRRPQERREPAIRDVVDVIVKRLALADRDKRFDLRVHVYESPVVNAFALPGGRIVVTTGLLRELSSPEELAGVLAHEMSHVTGRHQVNQLVHLAGLRMVVEGLLGTGGHLGRRLVEEGSDIGLRHLRFSREHESDADAQGVKLLAGALIDPTGAQRFMERLAAREPRHQGDGLFGMPDFLRTHPRSSERARTLDALIRALPPYEYLPPLVDWQALKAALGAGDHTSDVGPR